MSKSQDKRLAAQKAAKTIQRLKSFTERLESGVLIECTHVTVEHTPDGTLTTRRPGVINGEPTE